MTSYESRSFAEGLLGNRQEDWHSVEARAKANEKRDKKLSLDRAMTDLVEVTGLQDNEFHFEFYQKRFDSIGAELVPFEQDRLKRFVALFGLIRDKFFSVKLPIPEKWHHSLLEDYYTLSDVQPWADSYIDLSKADNEYSDYVIKWVDLKSGRKDYEYNSYTGKKEEIYFDPDYSLRLELGQEFSKLFLDRLKELLGMDKKSSTLQILQRNVNLKDLISEANRYPGELSSIMHVELKDECEKLKGDDPLSKLCASSILDSLYGFQFDIQKFQEQVVQILWQELVDSQKTDEQRQMVELIRRQISGQLYEGIIDTEVE